MNIRKNYEIKVHKVRLIDEEGNQVGIVDITIAIKRAKSVGLDLVEVSPKADPPVCKILDYGKYIYELKKQEKNNAKASREAKIEVKEFRIRPTTDTHDLEVKAKKAQKILDNGDKIKVIMQMKGREKSHIDVALETLNSFIALLSCKIEKNVDKKSENIFVILTK